MASLRERIEKGEHSNQTTGKSIRNQIAEETTWSAMNERGKALQAIEANKTAKPSAIEKPSTTEKPSASATFITNIDPTKKLNTTSSTKPVTKPIAGIEKVKQQQTNLKDMGMSSTQSVMETEKAKKQATEEARAAEVARMNALPGRNIPVVGDVLKGIDSLARATKPASDVALELYTPGAGLSVLNTGTQAAASAVGKLAPTLAKTLGLRGGRIAQTALTEGAVGLPAGVGNVLARNPQASNRELLEGAAYGAGGGVVLGGLGRGVIEGLEAGTKAVMRPVLESASGYRPTEPIIARRSPMGGRSSEPIPTPRINANEPDSKSVNTPPISNAESISQPTRLGESRANAVHDIPETPQTTKLQELQKLVDDANESSYKFYDEMKLKYGDNNYEWSRADDRIFEKIQKTIDKADAKLKEYKKKNPQPSTPDVTPIHPRADVTEQPIKVNNPRVETPRINPVDDVEEILQSVQQPRVRDRVASFLDEQEKAALERIARRKNNLSANPLPEWGDHAIVMAAQLGKGTIKAADFTEELVKRFGESVRPHAQAIYRQSKEVLRQQERRASKEGQEAIAFNESGIGDADSFGGKISTEKAARIVPFKAKWEKLRTQLVDDLAPLEGLEKRVTGTVASAEDSLYKSARMFKGVPERSARVIQDKLSPIVEAVEKSGYSSSDLGKYALAVHAKDVNKAGIKSGFTNAEIDDVIRRLGNPELEAARVKLVQVNKDMMKELVDNGVVSKELAEVLDDRWKNYIPLFRAFDDESVEIGKGLSDALANVASPIKSLKGSNRKVVDPLENMVKNIFQSIQASERNKVASKLHRLNEIDTDNNFIRELGKGEEVGRKNVVNVKVNGENIKYEVEPEVYKAMLNLDKESSNALVNILSKPASLLRAGATLTPEFSLRNPMRDIVQAFVVSKSGFNPITDFGVGLIQTIKKGNLYKEWVDNLGAYGNVMSMDRDVHKQALQKVLKEPTSKKFVNIVTGKSLIRALRYITDTTESATKVGEFRAALRKGVTPQEAAYRSRDIMDFGRAGTSIRQTNKIVAFLNANIQGKSKIIRSIKENPAGTIARAFTAVTVPTIGIFALNKQFANETQSETIKNAPDWMRNSFWLMAIPGTDMVARIPKPFDLASIFANLPEKALDFVYENDKDAFDGFVGRSLKDSGLPMQISGLLPLIEGMAGYSFFREGDIVPQREQGLKKSDQYDPIRTTEVGKLLASGVEKLNGGKGAFGNFASPRVMDNTIQGLTAGLGKYATDAVDSILQGMIPFTGKKIAPAIIDRPVAPEKSIEQQPLLRSFLVDPNQGGKIMDKFYSEKDKLTKEKASNKLNEITFGGTKKKPLYLEKEKESTLKSLSDASDDVSDFNKQIRTIEKDKLMTAKEKRKQIDLLIEKRKRAIAEVMK